MEALAPRRARARLDRELIVRSETCDAHVASAALSLARGEDAPLSDLRVVLRVAPAADALKVERLREDAALALRLTDKILAEMKAADS
jgi:predicted nucleotidyltransferase